MYEECLDTIATAYYLWLLRYDASHYQTPDGFSSSYHKANELYYLLKETSR